MPTISPVAKRVARPHRFSLKRKGELSYELTFGEQRCKCLIQDINEKGMFVICNDKLKVGEEVDVSFDLEQGLPFKAKVKLKFFDNGCFGAQFVNIDTRSAWNLQQYLAHNYEMRQSKLRRVR